MSYMQLIAFRDGKAVPDAEFRNDWGGAAMVWSALLKKYRMSIYPDDPVTKEVIRSPFTEWQDLWKAKLPLRPWEWITLQWTYDNALTKGEDALKLAEALEMFEEAHANGVQVCHLKAFARCVRELGRVDAIGLHASSVSDNPWIVYDRVDGDEDEENGDEEGDDEDTDERPYDLNVDSRHWWIDCSGNGTPPPASPRVEVERG